jgi:hypothetical protein
MSPRNVVEVESVSLPRELRQYRGDERWVAFSPDGYVSEAVSYSEAIRLANGRGGADTSVGFLVEPEPASKPDYSQPLPAILSKKGRKPAATLAPN